MNVNAPRMNASKKVAKRVSTAFVENLNILKLQSSIQWSGLVRLDQLREDNESKLSDVEWPKGSGRMHYGCASTGLLFDKQSGRCIQSSNVHLLLESVAETSCTAKQFEKWKADRMKSEVKHLSLKRGPKPKGYVEPEVEDEYA